MTQGCRVVGRVQRTRESHLPPLGQDYREGTMRLTFSEQPPRSGWEQGLLGVQEKPSPSKPSRQRHLGVGERGVSSKSLEWLEAEQTDK